jgi:hypothetical protein
MSDAEKLWEKNSVEWTIDGFKQGLMFKHNFYAAFEEAQACAAHEFCMDSDQAKQRRAQLISEAQAEGRRQGLEEEYAEWGWRVITGFQPPPLTPVWVIASRYFECAIYRVGKGFETRAGKKLHDVTHWARICPVESPDASPEDAIEK